MLVLAARFLRLLAAALALSLGAQALATAPVRVTDVRLWSGPEGTRLVLDLSGPVKHEVFALDRPDRIVVDLAHADLAMRRSLPPGQGAVKSLRSGPQPDNGLRLVLDLAAPQTAKSFAVGPDGASGHRLVVELPAPATSPVAAPTGNQVLAAGAAATGRIAGSATPPVKTVASAKGRDLVIAIDAGHGGQDPGATGRGGTREKDVTLAIARKLAAAVDAEDGMRAVLIRDGDYFITLGGRTRKARQLGADMFISIHADAVANRDVTGSSVYVLSLRGASDEAAKWLADSENSADLKGGVSLDDKSDVLASVLLDVTQKESVSDSVEAADNVLRALRSVGNVHGNLRVRHAGFVVLKSPDIPSMLVETSFISNPAEERRLRDPEHQQRLADAIRAGVRNYWYENPPPGTKLAALAANRRGGAAQAQTLAER
jgi:N-acetylmuramoyl-L-alanine amidase